MVFGREEVQTYYNKWDQLILAAEFGDVFIVEDTSTFKVIKTISKDKIIGKTVLFLEAYKDCVLIGTEKELIFLSK
jgi:hypothetical protein